MNSTPTFARTERPLVPGVARALAAIFKLGTRAALLEVAERSWRDARDLAASDSARGSALVRQLACKLTQRIGLLFLKPRVVTWRYQRGARSLEDNLAAGGAAVAAVNTPSVTPQPEDEEDDWDIPDGVEEVIEALLVALRDKDTVVRWSAAKGLGRVTARLPAELGDDVVMSVLECFEPTESDATWHGACLALAELSRRGLLLPARLPDAVPHVATALSYDVRRGPHSVGAHVRDAAAYVCWAFARAYAPEVLTPHAPALGPPLLVTACFDREVNCRRAASAAFQECVGRLGAFPHGIDVVAAADYFALGSRTNAYCVVSDFIAGFDEYRGALLQHLCDVKLSHWERATRELAGRALSVVGARDPEWIKTVALPTLLKRAVSPALEARHGATIGAAEALLALQNAREPCVTGALAEEVVTLVAAIEKARLYRGKGGEIMRAAACRYVSCLARVGQPLDKGPGPPTGPKSLRSALLASVEDSLKHPSSDIRDAAVDAIGAFADAYMRGGGGVAGAKRLVVKLASSLHTFGEGGGAPTRDANPAARRGAALALGVMPAELLLAEVPEPGGAFVPASDAAKAFASESGAGGEDGEEAPAPPPPSKTMPAWRLAVDALAASTIPEEDAEARDAEARTCAVRGLAGVVRALSSSGDADAEAAASVAARETIETFLTCLEDYCVDNRGDVGSWVREAAMEALPGVLAAAQRGGGVDATVSAAIVSALLKQSSEKIDRVRAAAAACACAALRGRDAIGLRPLADVPGVAAVLRATPETEAGAAAWAVPTVAFPALVGLITADDDAGVGDGGDGGGGDGDAAGLATYRASLVEGIVVSAGGVGDSLGKAAGGALTRALKADVALQRVVTSELVALLRRRKGVDRVVVPLLRVLDVLFSSGALNDVAPAFPSAPDAFALPLADALRAETKGSRDVAKLCLCVAALCHLAGCGPPGDGAGLGCGDGGDDARAAREGPGPEDAADGSTARVSATLGVLALLLNRYPRVRRTAAEALYVTLLGYEDAAAEYAGHDGVDLAAAIEVLAETRWDDELQRVKPRRNELYGFLRLTPPASAAKAAKAPATKAREADENESYAALVGSAGY